MYHARLLEDRRLSGVPGCKNCASLSKTRESDNNRVSETIRRRIGARAGSVRYWTSANCKVVVRLGFFHVEGLPDRAGIIFVRIGVKNGVRGAFWKTLGERERERRWCGS